MFSFSCPAAVATLLLLGWVNPSFSQHMNAADAPCRSSVITTDAVKCFRDAVRTADGELNLVYGRINRVLEASGQQILRSAERAWLRYRDTACLAERDLYGQGTAAEPAFLACVEAETRHHTAELRSAYWWRVEKFEK